MSAVGTSAHERSRPREIISNQTVFEWELESNQPMSKPKSAHAPLSALVYGPRIDFTALPQVWKQVKELAPPKQIEMKEAVNENLPRLKIILHGTKDIPKAGCTISVRILKKCNQFLLSRFYFLHLTEFGNAVPFHSPPTKKTSHTFNNDEYVFCLEPCMQPFLCLIRAKKPGGLASKKEIWYLLN